MVQENGVKNVKSCLNLVKNAKKIYGNCDCYLGYKKVIRNKYFMFECLKCGKKVFLLYIKISYNDWILEKRY